MIAGLRDVWPDVAELAGTDPAEAFDDAMRAVDHVLDLAGLERPDVPPNDGRGRDGVHTEAFAAAARRDAGTRARAPDGPVVNMALELVEAHARWSPRSSIRSCRC